VGPYAPLAWTKREQFMRIYAVRQAHQADAGGTEVAEQIGEVLDATGRETSELVAIATLRSGRRAYLVMLDERAVRLLGVIVPPLGGSGPWPG